MVTDKTRPCVATAAQLPSRSPPGDPISLGAPSRNSADNRTIHSKAPIAEQTPSPSAQCACGPAILNREAIQNCAKKSLPLSSTIMNAGKSSTSMRQIASIPSSSYSWISTFLMQFLARIAAGPPIEPR
jgi:hypothetical protein